MATIWSSPSAACCVFDDCQVEVLVLCNLSGGFHVKKLVLAAALAVAAMTAAPANAASVTYTFQNPGADLPGGNYTVGGTCTGINITADDLCAIDNAAGFTYLVDGVTVVARALSGQGLGFLMQDLDPNNSGLAVLTPGENSSDDQIQPGRNEAITFSFNSDLWLTGIDFNAGGDTNCATPNVEGPCGTFELYVDGIMMLATTALDDMTFGLQYFGSVFEIRATGDLGTGFTIGAITVETPLPAAGWFMLSGLAAFAAGRRRKAA